MAKYTIVAKRNFPLEGRDVAEGDKLGTLETDVDPGILSDLIKHHFASATTDGDSPPPAPPVE